MAPEALAMRRWPLAEADIDSQRENPASLVFQSERMPDRGERDGGVYVVEWEIGQLPSSLR